MQLVYDVLGILAAIAVGLDLELFFEVIEQWEAVDFLVLLLKRAGELQTLEGLVDIGTQPGKWIL